MRLKSPRGIAMAIGGVVLVAVVVTLAVRASGGSTTSAQLPPWTPLPRQVRVEVYNTTKLQGAARVATQLLRHAGLDVVASGTDATVHGLEHNRILVRGSDTTGVGRIIEALGGADVVSSPDPNRVLDLSVYLGKNFAPPPDRISAIP